MQIFLRDSWSAVKIFLYQFRLSSFIVRVGMPRYPPLSITIPAGMGDLERGDFVAGITVLAIWKPCYWAESSKVGVKPVVTDVGVKRDSRSSPRSLDISRDPLSSGLHVRRLASWACCLLAVLLMLWDLTITDAPFLDLDYYRCSISFWLPESWEGNRKSEVCGSI